jgi:hypothetical protein
MSKKTSDQSTSRLSKVLRPLFWDYPAAGLHWPEDRDLVIRRILTDGNWDSITWLQRKVGKSQLRIWFFKYKGRGLDPRRLRFWELVLNLPHRSVNLWMKPRDGNVWQARLGG